MRDAPGAGCREALRTPVRALMFTFRKTAQPTGSIHPFRRFDPPLPPENRPPGSIHSLRRFDPLLTSRKRRNDFESVTSQQFSGRVQPAYSSKLLDPADSVRAVRIKITPSSPPPKSHVRFWGRPGGGRQTSLIGDLQGNSNTVPLRGSRFDLSSNPCAPKGIRTQSPYGDPGLIYRLIPVPPREFESLFEP